MYILLFFVRIISMVLFIVVGALQLYGMYILMLEDFTKGLSIMGGSFLAGIIIFVIQALVSSLERKYPRRQRS